MGNYNSVCGCEPESSERDSCRLIRKSSRKRQTKIDRSLIKCHMIGIKRNCLTNTSKIYLSRSYSEEMLNSDDKLNDAIKTQRSFQMESETMHTDRMEHDQNSKIPMVINITKLNTLSSDTMNSDPDL